MRRFLVALLAVLAPLAATAQSVLPEADVRALREVIEAQLDAFRKDDAPRAFSFATDGIRQTFGNAETGILFRRDSPRAEDGAHRNVFEANVVRDNLGPRPAKSNSRPGSAGRACVVIEGAHHDLVFRDNEFVFSPPHKGAAFLIDATVKGLQLVGNRQQQVVMQKSQDE